MSGSFDLARVALSAQQFRRQNLLQEQQETVYGQQQDDRAALRAIAPAAAAGDPAALAQAAAIDPQAASAWQNLRNRASDQQWQQGQRETEVMGRYANGLLSRTPEQRAALWPQIRQEAQTRWGLQLGEAVPDDGQIRQFLTNTLPAADVWKYQRDQEAAAPRPLGTAPGGQGGGFVATTVGLESGGRLDARNPRSSATGPGQFIDETWLDLLPRVAPEYANLSRQEKLALRSDPQVGRQLSERMIAAYGQENGEKLAAQGLPNDPGTQGLAHRFGPGDAARLLRATPSVPVETILSPQILQANPELRGQTVGQIVGGIRARYGGGSAPAAGGAPGAAAPTEGGIPAGYTPLVTGAAGTPYTTGLQPGYQWAQGPGGPSDRRAIRIPGTVDASAETRQFNERKFAADEADRAERRRLETERNDIARQRANANRDGTGRLPAALAKDEITDLERIGTSSGIESDLASLTGLLDGGGLTLGPIERRLAEARLAINQGTPEDRNYATFKATLQNIANASLRLNKGVQTEGDAQRITAELVNNSNDAGAVRQRLVELQAINRRGVELTRQLINARRRGQGVPDLDASSFTVQPAAVGQGGGAAPAAPGPQATGGSVSADPPAAPAAPRQAAPSAANLPRPSTPAEARALPPGTRFLTPDGRVATVPAR